MRFIIILAVLGMLAFHTKKLSAQMEVTSWNISPAYGFVIPHYKHMQHFLTSHSWLIELEKQFFLTPRSTYLKPRPFSIKSHILSPGNPEVFGYGLAVYPEMKFFLGNKKNTTFNLGVGIACISKHYTLENYKNIYIGSHLNALLEFGFETKIVSTDPISINGKIHWYHYSNGASQMPNKGINIPMIGLVIAYSSRTNSSLKIEKEPFPFSTIDKWGLSFTGSIRQVFNQGAKYGIFNLRLDRYFGKKQNNPFFLGLECIDDISSGAKLSLSSKTKESDWDNLKIGIHAGWATTIDRIRLQLSLGSYLKNINFREENFFERLELQYRFNQRLSAIIALKSHLTTADVVEYGIKYNIP